MKVRTALAMRPPLARQSVPEQAVPDKTVPDEIVPGQSGAKQSAAGHSVLDQSAPRRSVPEPIVPDLAGLLPRPQLRRFIVPASLGLALFDLAVDARSHMHFSHDTPTVVGG